LDLVKKNEVYTIDITGMTHEGQGVGRIDNFTVFVDGRLKGKGGDKDYKGEKELCHWQTPSSFGAFLRQDGAFLPFVQKVWRMQSSAHEL